MRNIVQQILGDDATNKPERIVEVLDSASARIMSLREYARFLEGLAQAVTEREQEVREEIDG